MNRTIAKRFRPTDEFRAKVVKEALDYKAKTGKNGVPKVAKKHGMHQTTLYNWIAQAKKKQSMTAPPPKKAKVTAISGDASAFADLVQEQIAALDKQIVQSENQIDALNRQRRALEEFLEI